MSWWLKEPQPFLSYGKYLKDIIFLKNEIAGACLESCKEKFCASFNLFL